MEYKRPDEKEFGTVIDWTPLLGIILNLLLAAGNFLLVKLTILTLSQAKVAAIVVIAVTSLGLVPGLQRLIKLARSCEIVMFVIFLLEFIIEL